MQVDQTLIRECQMKATGASNHWLANQLTTYQMYAEEGPVSTARRLERVLRQFVLGSPDCGCPALRGNA